MKSVRQLKKTKEIKESEKSVFRVFKFNPFVNLHTEEFIANIKGLINRTV